MKKISNIKKQDRMIGLKAAILTMSFLQMATSAIAAVLAQIAEEFLRISEITIQYLMTFPNLMIVVMSMLTARLSICFSKRTLSIIGLFLGCLAGVGSFLFHESIVFLYIWAGMLGTGIGLIIPIATSLISDYFEGNEKDKFLGYQTSAANIGSMVMTFVGGMLASIGWYYNYLVYLLAIPGLILTFLFVPKENVVQTEITTSTTVTDQKNTASSQVWFYFVVAALFMLLFYIAPTNLALLTAERGINNPMIAGTAATILLFGGTVMGLFFGKISAQIKKNAIPAGFFVLMTGYLLIYGTHQISLLYAGSFLIGTSNTLVLTCCMGSVATVDKAQSTFRMSMVFAVANLGTFFTPALTGISKQILQTEMVSARFLFTAITAAVIMITTAIFLNKREGKND